VAAHFVAKYSYGIYLSHIALIMWISGLPVPVAARVALLVLTAVIVPIAIFHLIEHPMIVVGHRLAERLFPQHPSERVHSSVPEVEELQTALSTLN
jgi:peptidoglycan/LPS O-acetylase OafA/YrhL